MFCSIYNVFSLLKMTKFLREKENGSCTYFRRQNNPEADWSFSKFIFSLNFLLKMSELKNTSFNSFP